MKMSEETRMLAKGIAIGVALGAIAMMFVMLGVG